MFSQWYFPRYTRNKFRACRQGQEVEKFRMESVFHHLFLDCGHHNTSGAFECRVEHLQRRCSDIRWYCFSSHFLFHFNVLIGAGGGSHTAVDAVLLSLDGFTMGLGTLFSSHFPNANVPHSWHCISLSRVCSPVVPKFQYYYGSGSSRNYIIRKYRQKPLLGTDLQLYSANTNAPNRASLIPSLSLP